MLLGIIFQKIARKIGKKLNEFSRLFTRFLKISWKVATFDKNLIHKTSILYHWFGKDKHFFSLNYVLICQYTLKLCLTTKTYSRWKLISQVFLNPLNTNPTKWSNTQTIRRQIIDELFKCVWPFCEIGTSRVKFLTFEDKRNFIGYFKHLDFKPTTCFLRRYNYAWNSLKTHGKYTAVFILKF